MAREYPFLAPSDQTMYGMQTLDQLAEPMTGPMPTPQQTLMEMLMQRLFPGRAAPQYSPYEGVSVPRAPVSIEKVKPRSKGD